MVGIKVLSINGSNPCKKWFHRSVSKYDSRGLLYKSALSSISNNNLFFINSPKRQILDFQNEFADDYFRFNESGRKFPKMVENTKKRKFALYEQFLLFLQCFQ